MATVLGGMDPEVKYPERNKLSGPKYCCFEIGVATSNEPQNLLAVEFAPSPGQCEKVHHICTYADSESNPKKPEFCN
jgi:hypothetical protein